MENTIVKIDAPELQGIEQSKAEQIRKTFEPMAKMLSGFEKTYNDLVIDANKEVTKDITARAKRLRIDIGKVRIETGKLKDKQKEYIKLEDRAIMGVHNILVWAVKEKEDKLKDIERHFEIQEQKRLEALQAERVEKLSVYVEDAHERDLTKFADDEFEALLAMKKKEQEDRIAAEKKAEEERIEKERIYNLRNDREIELRPYYQFVPEQCPDFGLLSNSEWDDFFQEMKDAKYDFDKQQEEQRKENERLRKEAEERARLAKIEEERRAEEERIRQEKADAERRKAEEKERKEREEYEAKLKAEREERERIQAELRAREEAERKAAEEEESRLQAELNKGDAAKVKDLIEDILLLKTKYTFKSAKNKKMYSEVSILMDKVVSHIKNK